MCGVRVVELTAETQRSRRNAEVAEERRGKKDRLVVMCRRRGNF
jgi:hypothetical protein